MVAQSLVEQTHESTRILTQNQVESCLDMAAVIESVEDAFEAYGDGSAVMPPKTYLDLEINGDFRAMPAAVENAAGIKWVNVHPDNPEEYNLPTVMGTVILSDPDTGYPLAIMDGTKLTQYRTGAAAGVATKYLASPASETLGLLGAGAQAHTQLAAVSEVLNLKRVVVADVNEAAVDRFVETERGRDAVVTGGKPADVAACDVVSTTTPSREPIIESEWLGDDTHVNAIGADAEGKQELDADVLLDSQVVIDDWEQCSHSGEINFAVHEGLMTREDIAAELDELVTGQEAVSRDDRTVFDSTGLAIQDIATAYLVYQSAVDSGIGTDIDLVEE